MCIEHSAKETKCRGESGGGRGDGGRAALEKWTVEAGVTLAHTHTHIRAHIHTHTQISSVFGLLLPPALIMSVQSSHDASLLPLVDLGIKRVLPSILLSTPTRAALCLTKRVIGGRVTGVG